MVLHRAACTGVLGLLRLGTVVLRSAPSLWVLVSGVVQQGLGLF